MISTVLITFLGKNYKKELVKRYKDKKEIDIIKLVVNINLQYVTGVSVKNIISNINEKEYIFAVEILSMKKMIKYENLYETIIKFTETMDNIYLKKYIGFLFAAENLGDRGAYLNMEKLIDEIYVKRNESLEISIEKLNIKLMIPIAMLFIGSIAIVMYPAMKLF